MPRRKVAAVRPAADDMESAEHGSSPGQPAVDRRSIERKRTTANRPTFGGSLRSRNQAITGATAWSCNGASLGLATAETVGMFPFRSKIEEESINRQATLR